MSDRTLQRKPGFSLMWGIQLASLELSAPISRYFLRLRLRFCAIVKVDPFLSFLSLIPFLCSLSLSVSMSCMDAAYLVVGLVVVLSLSLYLFCLFFARVGSTREAHAKGLFPG